MLDNEAFKSGQEIAEPVNQKLNPLIAAAFSIGTALFSGCASENPVSDGHAITEESVDHNAMLSSAVMVAPPPSPVPDDQTLSSYLGEVTYDLHTASRNTNFVRSYKEGFMSKDQYALNLVQRYTILKSVIDSAPEGSQLREILGQEALDLLSHYEQDLNGLGKPLSSITEKDVLPVTRECIDYIDGLDDDIAAVAVAQIYLGGASAGGPRIANGLRKHLGEDTPVMGFSGTSDEAFERFATRLDAVGAHHHAAIVEADCKLFEHFNKINNDPAFGDLSSQ